MQFPNNIFKKHREASVLILEDISKLLNIPEKELLLMESGQLEITHEFLIGYHLIFSVPMEDLLGPYTLPNVWEKNELTRFNLDE